MNRNKKIWVVIAAILVIGTAVTCMTYSYVKKNTPSMTVKDASLETTAGQIFEVIPETIYEANPASIPEEKAVAGAGTQGSKMARLGKAEAVPETAAAYAEDSGKNAVVYAETLPEGETVISPLEGAPVSETKPEKETVSDYMAHLEEIDRQTTRMRQEDTGNYSSASAAEAEYMMWDAELNTIYSELMDLLDEEAGRKLQEEERAWIKERDTKAEEAVKKVRGTSAEAAEYTASLAASTRSRVYELAEYYNQAAGESRSGDK